MMKWEVGIGKYSSTKNLEESLREKKERMVGEREYELLEVVRAYIKTEKLKRMKQVSLFWIS